jgi:ABC-type multidrug transport system fused ATPase/permease subunit
LAAYFCLFAGAGFALYIPRLTGQAIDQALAGQTQALVVTAFVIGGAGLIRSGFSYFQTYLAEYLSQKVAYDLRNLLYNHIQKLNAIYCAFNLVTTAIKVLSRLPILFSCC